MPSRALIGGVMAAIVGLSACADPLPDHPLDEDAPSDISARASFDFVDGPVKQWKLPRPLREISGLAMTGDGRLFAIEDERALIYQLDYQSGSIVKMFSLGGPPLKGDFEGIAVAPDDLYMVTSVGKLYQFREGANGAAVRYSSYESGTRGLCEVEGLAYVGSRDALALACKRVYDGKKRWVRVYFWSLRTQALSTETLEIDIKDARSMMAGKRLHVSGVEWRASNGNLLMVAARERTVIEVDASGKLLWATALKKRHHRQAEGITLDTRGNLLISDEGGSGAARLAIYQPTTVPE